MNRPQILSDMLIQVEDKALPMASPMPLIRSCSKDTSEDHEDDGCRTRDGKLTAFSRLFQCISDAVEFYGELSGSLFSFGSLHLFPKGLFGRNKAHQVIGNLFGIET